jgi:hypothetical protein
LPGEGIQHDKGQYQEGREQAKSSPLQLLSNYIHLLKATVGIKCKHLKEVTAIWCTLRNRVDLFVEIRIQEIIFILWAVFLDAREFFSHQIEDATHIPESQLKYTTAFLSLGWVPSDIMGPSALEQFGERASPSPSTITHEFGGGSKGSGLYRSQKTWRFQMT